MNFTLGDLASFLVKAKRQSYAGGGKEITPQRPNFKELEYSEGSFNYRDSYAGYFSAPGQEVVRFNGNPVWAMAYSGGMVGEYVDDKEMAGKAFSFLKRALMLVDAKKPFRGPEVFQEGDFKYLSEVTGDVGEFSGEEKILWKGKEVFRQHYIGALVRDK